MTTRCNPRGRAKRSRPPLRDWRIRISERSIRNVGWSSCSILIRHWGKGSRKPIIGTFTQGMNELAPPPLPSLVVVRGHRFGAGAGIVWDANGIILTNNHVVGRRLPIVLLQNDQEYESRLLARDPDVGLALLSMDATHLTPLKPASVSPRVGEMVFAFGHPWGQRNAVTRGIVNASGEVIGINAMIVGGDQGISIAASVARDFVSRTLANQKTEGHAGRRHHGPEDVI